MSTLVFLTSLFCHFRLFCKLAAAQSYFSSFIWLGWLRTQWDNTRERGKATKDMIGSLLRRCQKSCCQLRRKNDRHWLIKRRSLLLLFTKKHTREKHENMESKGRQEQYSESERNFFKNASPEHGFVQAKKLQRSPFISPYSVLFSFSFHSFLAMFSLYFLRPCLSGSTFVCVFMRHVPIYSPVYLYFSSSSLSAVAPRLYFPN